jgi:excisionase family DNA binding protein
LSFFCYFFAKGFVYLSRFLLSILYYSSLMTMQQYLTPEQVAERLSIEKTTVYSWLKQEKLSGVKLGKLWRIAESDVSDFVRKNWRTSRRKTAPKYIISCHECQ